MHLPSSTHQGRQLVRRDNGYRRPGASRKEMSAPCRTRPFLPESVSTEWWEQNLSASQVLGSRGLVQEVEARDAKV